MSLLDVLTEIRDALASADREEAEPLLDALSQSLHMLGTEGTTQVLALWLEDGLREAVSGARGQQGSWRSDQVSETVAAIRLILEQSGLEGIDATLRLALLAAAKGDSRAELDQVLDRFNKGLLSNAFVSLDPGNKRFPVEIRSTGSLGVDRVAVR